MARWQRSTIEYHFGVRRLDVINVNSVVEPRSCSLKAFIHDTSRDARYTQEYWIGAGKLGTSRDARYVQG